MDGHLDLFVCLIFEVSPVTFSYSPESGGGSVMPVQHSMNFRSHGIPMGGALHSIPISRAVNPI